MYKFFESCAIQDEEKLSGERTDKIKALVLSRIEEEKPMKKHFGIKPLVIAAAVTAASAASLVTANASSNGAISEGISRVITLIIDGQEVTGEYNVYKYSDGNDDEQLEAELSDDFTYYFYSYDEELAGKYLPIIRKARQT